MAKNISNISDDFTYFEGLAKNEVIFFKVSRNLQDYSSEIFLLWKTTDFFLVQNEFEEISYVGSLI